MYPPRVARACSYARVIVEGSTLLSLSETKQKRCSAVRSAVSLAGDDAFNPSTGTGYVSPSKGPGDYAYAVAKGVQVAAALLFETFGGFSPDVVRLLHAAAATVKK